MGIQIFNSLSREKEPFIPLEEGKVKMYVCGPTVYNYIHIGNARPVTRVEGGRWIRAVVGVDDRIDGHAWMGLNPAKDVRCNESAG